MRATVVACTLFLTSFLGTAWSETGPAPKTVEVVTEAEVFGLGRTPEEARWEALQRAREKAVAEVGGIEVSAQQLRLKSEAPEGVLDAFSSLIRTSSSGRIVREEARYRTSLVDEVPVYHVTLLAEVAIEEGRRDPGFTLEIGTVPDSHTFRHGEDVVLEVTPTRDCHLTVLNVLSDGNVAVLFPNRYASTSLVPAGKTFRLPESTGGFGLRVDAAEDRSRAHEQILVIATLDAIPFRLQEAKERSDSVPMADYESTLTALNRWLIQIPVERRTEAVWNYEVVR